MKKKQFDFINTYKFNSVFFKTLLLMILLSFSLAAVFYASTLSSASENIREKTQTANLNMLDKTAAYAELYLSYINEELTKIASNEYVVNSVVIPGPENALRNYNLIRYLKTAVGSSPLIGSVVIYACFDGTIYTENGLFASSEPYKDRDVIEAYNMHPGGDCAMKNSGFTTHINIIDGRILMFRDFPLPRPNQIGILLLEVDKSELFKIIQGKNAALQNPIYVFDCDGSPLFDDFLGYPDLSYLFESGQLKDSSDSFSSSDKNVYFYSRSGSTNWTYVYPVGADALAVSWWNTFVMMLPVLSVFLFLAIAFSIYITRAVYKPIRNLMETVVSTSRGLTPDETALSAKNELEFLGIAYENAVEQRQKLAHIMKDVSPVVLEKLFLHLLSGAETNPREIESTLSSVSSDFCIDGRYMVFVFRLSNPDGSRLTDVEFNICSLSVKNIAGGVMGDHYRRFFLETGDATVTLVVEFVSEVPEGQSTGVSLTLYKSLANRAASLPFSITIGRGGLYVKLINLKYSYFEAVEDLNYKMYLGGHTEAEEPAAEAGGQSNGGFGGFNKYYFNRRMKDMIQGVSDGGVEDAYNFISYITQRIIRNDPDPASVRKTFEALIDSVTEIMIGFSIKTDEDIFRQSRSVAADLGLLDGVGALESYTVGICRRAIVLMDAYNKKHLHKHIVRAKEYIEKNYMDSSLSLNAAAEFSGINPSYLSRLFKENTQMNFVEYLNDIRIEKAKQLLHATSFTSKEIGFKIGFNTIQNFIRVFKRHEGVTPGEYRSRIKHRQS